MNNNLKCRNCGNEVPKTDEKNCKKCGFQLTVKNVRVFNKNHSPNIGVEEREQIKNRTDGENFFGV